MSIRRKLFALALVLALLGAACGGDDDDSDAGSTTPGDAPSEEAEDEPADATPGAIVVADVNFDTGVAVLRNDGSEPVDLGGHWLCDRPSYAELSSGVLAPGETREVSLGGFDASGGEVAVYTSSDFGSADDMIAYVQWGSGGGRASVAADAGLWTGDPVAPAGATITLTGPGGSADSWQ